MQHAVEVGGQSVDVSVTLGGLQRDAHFDISKPRRVRQTNTNL